MSQTVGFFAYRYVYGKVVQQRGGPVESGFEHCPTSISHGMPDCLLPYCRPIENTSPKRQESSSSGDSNQPEPVQLSSISPSELVHPEHTREGALYFAPCCCDGGGYMVATRLRARPELGDGGLGRTHTQLVSFAFPEAVWNRYAPRLLANAHRWLRAEPDLLEFHLGGDYPMAEFGPEQLPEIPPCEQGPLPPPGTLLWRLATAVEDRSTNLRIGPADRIDSVRTFLRALACTVALMPRELRIYLTAAAGFREPQAPFAIQFLPDAPAIAATEPGFLQQIAGKLLAQDKDVDHNRWHDYWSQPAQDDKDPREVMPALPVPGNPGGGLSARARLAEAIDRHTARRSRDDLEDWLDGKRPAPPLRPEPRYPDTGTAWIRTLTGRLNDIIRGGDLPGATKALTELAWLIDTEGDEENLIGQALYWAKAWRSAAFGSEKTTYNRNILRWSALSASPLLEAEGLRSATCSVAWEKIHDRDVPGAELGRFRDFSELGAIARALRHAKLESPHDSALLERAWGGKVLNRRREDLRARADQILIRHPRSLIDLAAAYPALLRPGAEDPRPRASPCLQTLDILSVAARLDGESAFKSMPLAAPRPTQSQPAGATFSRDAAHVQRVRSRLETAPTGLGEAARTVAEESFSVRLEEGDALQERLRQRAAGYLRGTLDRYWRWALAPDSDREIDDPVWPAVVRGILEHLLPKLRLAGTAELLWRHYQAAFEEAAGKHFDRTKVEPASRLLGDTCLQTLAPFELNPVAVFVGLLQAIADPAQLARKAQPFHTFADALWQRILDAVSQEWIQAHPRSLGKELLPAFTAFLERAASDPHLKPEPETTRRLLQLFDRLLARWLQLGIPNREQVTEVLDRLEGLTLRTPGAANVVGGVLFDAMQKLSDRLGDCLLAWTTTDPPAPRLDSSRNIAQSPIRRNLAATLGFPLCAYFGHLTPSESGIETNNVKEAAKSASEDQRRELIEYLADPSDPMKRYERVLAYGASRRWKDLFDAGMKETNDLRNLMKEQPSSQAIQAIAMLITEAPEWRDHIDPETWFTVAFFASLDDPNSSAYPVEFPESLKKALLSNGSQHNNSYPIQMGQMIANGKSALGRRLRKVFETEESNQEFVTRVLLLPQSGWVDFGSRAADDKRLRMLRVLFTLGLIVATESPKTKQNRLQLRYQTIWQAMQIREPSAKDSITNFFNHHANREYAEAFPYAIERAGMNKLPGWPEIVQPRDIRCANRQVP